MQKLHALLLVVFLISYSCKMNTNEETIEKWKGEILETEQSFAQ